jgi:hypothetical protein
MQPQDKLSRWRASGHTDALPAELSEKELVSTWKRFQRNRATADCPETMKKQFMDAKSSTQKRDLLRIYLQDPSYSESTVQLLNSRTDIKERGLDGNWLTKTQLGAILSTDELTEFVLTAANKMRQGITRYYFTSEYDKRAEVGARNLQCNRAAEVDDCNNQLKEMEDILALGDGAAITTDDPRFVRDVVKDGLQPRLPQIKDGLQPRLPQIKDVPTPATPKGKGKAKAKGKGKAKSKARASKGGEGPPADSDDDGVSDDSEKDSGSPPPRKRTKKVSCSPQRPPPKMPLVKTEPKTVLPQKYKDMQTWRKDLQKYVGKLVGAAAELHELSEKMTGKADVGRKQKMRSISSRMQELVQQGLDNGIGDDKETWSQDAVTMLDEGKVLVKQARALLR